jgi:hypothetical protein
MGKRQSNDRNSEVKTDQENWFLSKRQYVEIVYLLGVSNSTRDLNAPVSFGDHYGIDLGLIAVLPKVWLHHLKPLAACRLAWETAFENRRHPMQTPRLHATYYGAIALLDRLPARGCAANSQALYARNFRKMWAEPVLDALRPGDARDTYGVRRAAMFWGARELLVRLLKKFHTAAETGARVFGRRLLRILARVVSRVSAAIAIDPPLLAASADFSQPSRWTLLNCGKQRGAGSKRHVLSQLAEDWREQVLSALSEDCRHRPLIAVMSLCPCRPSESVPGERPGGFSPGVVVTLLGRQLRLDVAPLKTHDGKFGASKCGITVDIDESGPAAKYLADLCRRNDGRYTVNVAEVDSLRSFLARLGRRLFPGGPNLSAYVFRAQRLADIKAAFSDEAAAAAASAAGHCSDRSGRHYGHASHGRKRGIVAVHTARAPKLVSTLKGRKMRELREHQISI